VLGVLLGAVVVAAAVASAAGTLTHGFGNGGIVRLKSTQVYGLATQKDGRLVVAGYSGRDMLVLRVATNGGRGTPFNAGRGVGNAVAVQSDGKIVVAGRSSDARLPAANGDMVVRRFNANGSLDRKFGSGGTAHAPGAVANAVAIGPGGTIIIAGYVVDADGTPRVAIARFHSNGSNDHSFGHGGFATVDLGRFSQARGVAVQHDSKIVISGDQRPDLRVTNALIARVSRGGSLDRGFSSGGVYFYYHPGGGAASGFSAITIDQVGRIVAAGGDIQNSGPHALFVRLSKGGHPDSGFGSRGVIAPASGRNFNADTIIGAAGIAVAAHGEIVATGEYEDAGQADLALWAITASGHLDSRVGPGGLSRVSIPGVLGAETHAGALARDGHIYSGGNVVAFGTSVDGFVARFNGF
jgi:uncharacterized delta-60 repeat protein